MLSLFYGVSDLVVDPVHGILTLAQVLHQFLGLQQTHAFLLGLLQQQVPQTVQLLQTGLRDKRRRFRGGTHRCFCRTFSGCSATY